MNVYCLSSLPSATTAGTCPAPAIGLHDPPGFAQDGRSCHAGNGRISQGDSAGNGFATTMAHPAGLPVITAGSPVARTAAHPAAAMTHSAGL